MIKVTETAFNKVLASFKELDDEYDVELVEFYDRYGTGEDIGIVLRDNNDGEQVSAQLRSGRVLNMTGLDETVIIQDDEAKTAEDVVATILYMANLY